MMMHRCCSITKSLIFFIEHFKKMLKIKKSVLKIPNFTCGSALFGGLIASSGVTAVSAAR